MSYIKKQYQIRGTMAMEMVVDGDVWTFLNRIKRELESHQVVFKLEWANAYLQPYPSNDNKNFLMLKVRGFGTVTNVNYANDKIAMIVLDAAEANYILVCGGFGFEACD